MSNETLALTPDLYRYLREQSLREGDLLRALREETAQHPKHSMQIAPEEGQFLAFLVRLVGARRCLEIGVFTGYSSLGAIDLTRDPSRPNLVYAALWNFRFPFYGHYGVLNGPGGGIWRSNNGGRTWSRLADRGLPRRGLGRIGLAIVPGSRGRVLFALVGARHGGVFRSTDGGRRWSAVNRDPRLWGGDWYFGEINTDPGHPDTLFVMNTAFYESTDSGRHFVSIKGSPSGDDFHTLWIDPRNPRRTGSGRMTCR